MQAPRSLQLLKLEFVWLQFDSIIAVTEVGEIATHYKTLHTRALQDVLEDFDTDSRGSASKFKPEESNLPALPTGSKYGAGLELK